MNTKPYALVADVHLSNWTAFSTVNADGTNNRLRMLIDEMIRAGTEVKKAGGDTIRIAGDLFHVRGSIAPSVLNPTLDFIKWAGEQGLKIEIIAGNHDLEGKHSDEVGNAVRALGSYSHVEIMTYPRVDNANKVVMVPWVDSLDDLRNIMSALADEIRSGGNDTADFDLIIHAPLNGVIPGLPDKGLTTSELQALGFKRVFAGHYHNHKELAENFAVTSIGALAHHSWSDVNSKAGFLIVAPNKVLWRKSHCPDFVDISSAQSEEEMLLMSNGHYVRAQVSNSKVSTTEEIREALMKAGARGVVIRHVKDTSGVQRQGAVSASIKSGASIQQSVSEFVSAKHSSWEKQKVDELNDLCQKILARASV